MPTHQDGAENRDKAYSELRIFEDKLGKVLRDKHDRSYFLELHTYIHTYTHNKMMITRETLNSVKLHTHIHTFIEAPFAGLYRAFLCPVYTCGRSPEGKQKNCKSIYFVARTTSQEIHDSRQRVLLKNVEGSSLAKNVFSLVRFFLEYANVWKNSGKLENVLWHG